jgi:hypothetical protein
MCDVIDHVADVVVDYGDIRSKGLWLCVLFVGRRVDVVLGGEVIGCLEVRDGVESNCMFGQFSKIVEASLAYLFALGSTLEELAACWLSDFLILRDCPAGKCTLIIAAI